jgi:hypothetical protein
VRVDEAGEKSAAFEISDFGFRISDLVRVVQDGGDAAIFDGDGGYVSGLRTCAVNEAGVEEG